ncbi:MAG: hypothetical protein ACREMP_02645 [Candidatus Tyrphobacter sp.]
MLRRIDADDSGIERAEYPRLAQLENEPVAAPTHLVGDSDVELLGRGHPKWVRDGASISQRAKAILARLRPIAIRVLHFLDHRLRSIVIAGRTVRIDASGSYKVE